MSPAVERSKQQLDVPVANSPKVTYVVQRLDAVEVVVARPVVIEEDCAAREEVQTEKRNYWVDVARVEVPAKSKRETVVKRAIEEAGLVVEPGGEPLRLRTLDVRSAHVSVVSAVQAPPVLEID